MNKKDYKMFVDDSGYTYTEIGQDGKEYEVPHFDGTGVYSGTQLPHAEPGHHKYFVGILIPTEQLNEVTNELLRAGKVFRSQLNSPENIKEIHASDLYSDEDDVNRRAFVKYLQKVVSIAAKYKLNIVVSPKDTTIRLRGTDAHATLKNYLNTCNNAPFVAWHNHAASVSGKSARRATVYFQKLSLIELHNIAKMYLSDGGCVSTIMCDEGLGKRGAQIKLDSNTNLMFLSSDSNPLIQFADNIAWLYNCVNVVVPDRIGRKQCEMLDSDIMLTEAYKQIQGFVIKEKSQRTNFQDYIYNKYNLRYKQIQSFIKSPHFKYNQVKYPLVPIDDDHTM